MEGIFLKMSVDAVCRIADPYRRGEETVGPVEVLPATHHVNRVPSHLKQFRIARKADLSGRIDLLEAKGVVRPPVHPPLGVAENCLAVTLLQGELRQMASPFLPDRPLVLIDSKELTHVRGRVKDHPDKPQGRNRVHCPDGTLMDGVVVDHIAVAFFGQIILPESCHPFDEGIDLGSVILVPGVVEPHRKVHDSIG